MGVGAGGGEPLRVADVPSPGGVSGGSEDVRAPRRGVFITPECGTDALGLALFASTYDSDAALGLTDAEPPGARDAWGGEAWDRPASGRKKGPLREEEDGEMGPLRGREGWSMRSAASLWAQSFWSRLMLASIAPSLARCWAFSRSSSSRASRSSFRSLSSATPLSLAAAAACRPSPSRSGSVSRAPPCPTIVASIVASFVASFVAWRGVAASWRSSSSTLRSASPRLRSSATTWRSSSSTFRSASPRFHRSPPISPLSARSRAFSSCKALFSPPRLLFSASAPEAFADASSKEVASRLCSSFAAPFSSSVASKC
mmetsp:Transcript_41901/g.98723  ORF Transcript_41901/g.98723 Transcript_41901/m.98723 type:complete len:315 (-) Transcript_41901:228-1172(-)